jgi:hypothetical protein
MNTRNDPNLDPNLDPADDNGGAIAPANDNGGAIAPANDNSGTITPAAKANALASTSLAALAATFKKVDTSPLGNRSFLPLLQYKSREGGIWTFGQRRTIPEAGSKWAVNPTSFMWGFVCWSDTQQLLGERLVPISEPLPEVTKLPDTGFKWQQEIAVNLKCTCGIDSGAEVVLKTSTEGGKGELVRLVDAVRDRLNGQHEGNVAPIVLLESSFYPHEQFGKTYIPVMTIVDWMPLDGPAPAPEPASPPPPTEQPRRRRVG